MTARHAVTGAYDPTKPKQKNRQGEHPHKQRIGKKNRGWQGGSGLTTC